MEPAISFLSGKIIVRGESRNQCPEGYVEVTFEARLPANEPKVQPSLILENAIRERFDDYIHTFANPSVQIIIFTKTLEEARMRNLKEVLQSIRYDLAECITEAKKELDRQGQEMHDMQVG